jgi:DNA-binding MarR family transcriptional regulator
MLKRDMKLVDINHKDIDSKVFMLFVQTADAVLKYADTYFYRESGLSTIKFVVLEILEVNGGTMTPSEIASWTLRERHNITTLVARMKKEGLVTTVRSSDDMRSVNIKITQKGREVLGLSVPAARDIVKRMMSSIAENEVTSLQEILSVLRRNAFDELLQIAESS